MLVPRHSTFVWIVSCALCILLVTTVLATTAAAADLVRDRIWAWGNPEMAEPGSHTFETYAAAGPAERAHLLGVPNIILAGLGLPQDDSQAEAITREVSTPQGSCGKLAGTARETTARLYMKRHWPECVDWRTGIPRSRVYCWTT